MKFDLEQLVRRNIKKLRPYSSARAEFNGEAQIFLDANENSFGSPLERNYNRYPDPLQSKIKIIISKQQNAKTNEIFIGNGSDEAIDLLFRIFCEPQRDNILICPPTYGMYEVSAVINDIQIKRINLKEDFQLDLDGIQNAIDEHTKLIFICSPNNPTGNSISRTDILKIADDFQGIVIVDEAYIHFSKEQSLIGEINNFPNLVVLQTFSKAWGLAGLRVGLAFSNERVINYFNKVKPPYNISEIAQEAILTALDNEVSVKNIIEKIIEERENLVEKLAQFSFIQKVYPTDANFVLVKTDNANGIYRFLINDQIVVRNRHNVELCADCLRITIGTPEENTSLLKCFEKIMIEESLIAGN